MKEFNREDLEFFLPEEFKGLSKSYILDKIFDKEIQNQWKPQIGDIIVGCTGNVFVISNLDYFLEDTRYYFGGGMCNRDGGIILDETYCYTANESGIYYHPTEGVMNNCFHSSIREFRFVPYPHELPPPLSF